MIQLEGVSKSFRTAAGIKPVLRDVHHRFQRGQVTGLIGANGAGKTTVLRMLAGIVRPDRGRIVTTAQVSWPVGFAGGLHGDMTGAQNIRFVARVYGRDSRSMEDVCRQMSELGQALALPVRTYSSGMRARLAFAMSMAVPFDFYLMDEITSVGDARFRTKSAQILRARLSGTGGIIVSHAPDVLRDLCTHALVLEQGKLIAFDTVEAALAHHTRQMRVSSSSPV